MTFEFRDGYWKCMLDLYNFIQAGENNSINSKKKYKKFISTLINTLLTDAEFLDKWAEVGGMTQHIETHDCCIKTDGTFFIKRKDK